MLFGNKFYKGIIKYSRHVMKQPNNIEEVVPIRATSAELKTMALRQQQQIDTQQQLLVAKEQRLRFLKLQESKGMEAAEENERLRRLREKVDAQETKLKRLRALRGQVDLQKSYNVTLSNDLDSIRALFNEKEKELSLAVAKVDILTRQLEEIRRDRRGPLALIQPGNTSTTTKELENLRRELMYRNQLSLQQDAKLHLQREALQQRQAELYSVDQRILQLQERLNRKKSSNLFLQRISNDQNDNTLNNNDGNSGFHMQNRVNNMKHLYTQQKRGNIVAVEPYNHTPSKRLQSEELRYEQNEMINKKINNEENVYADARNVIIKDADKINENIDNLFVSKTLSFDSLSVMRENVKKEFQMQAQNVNKTKDQNAPSTDSKQIKEDNDSPLTQLLLSPVKAIKSMDQEHKQNIINSDYDNGSNDRNIQIKPKTVHVIPSGNLLTPPRKPVSSVAPNSFTSNSVSSSVNPKVHIVSPSVSLITQLANSEKEKPRPALPPKPLKGQTRNSSDDQNIELRNEKFNTNNAALFDQLPIKAKPLTIKKQAHIEQPKLKSVLSKYQQSNMQKNDESDNQYTTSGNIQNDSSLIDEKVSLNSSDELDNCQLGNNEIEEKTEGFRRKKNLTNQNIKMKLARRVSFDPLALLLDASLEEKYTKKINPLYPPSFPVLKFLVNFGCDVNAQDSDGWTPLHCAASCNNLPMVKFLVESGACLFASTLSDHETPAEKCEEDEEGFDGCSEYLYNVQEKLGIMNNGTVYAVFSYDAINPDELSFYINERLTILRKGDEAEREWWWAKNESGKEGYIPRNLLGVTMF
uniref:CSON005636 protein n=1 Tax=Culicoides sonorensis TaxID=179676 RepID=A0A336LMT8_CULSO